MKPVFDDISLREAWQEYRETVVPTINAKVGYFWLARLRHAFNAGVECGKNGAAIPAKAQRQEV